MASALVCRSVEWRGVVYAIRWQEGSAEVLVG
jgi:hypothetical protein